MGQSRPRRTSRAAWWHTLLTVVAGTVDAVSILRIDHVFVANVTGNVIFIGLALVGAREFSITASFVVLASFLIGAALSGRVFHRHHVH